MYNNDIAPATSHNNDIAPATSHNYIWHPIANKLYSRNPKQYPFSVSCCVVPPLETLPPRDTCGGVVYLRIVLSPEEASRHMSITKHFLWGGVVSTSPKPQAGRPPLVSCPRLLIQFIRSYPPYWRPFLRPQPEDAPCCGDRDPLIIVLGAILYQMPGWHLGILLCNIVDLPECCL